MLVNQEYLTGICEFFNSKDGIIYDIEDLTNDYEKFIFHVKHYIDTATNDQIMVELNSQTETEIMYGAPFVQLKVYEFFEGIIRKKEFDPATIPPWAWRIDRQPIAETPKLAPIKKQKPINKTNGLFQ